MEGDIPNHIWHLSSLEELYLDGNHFSSLPTGISRLTNLRVLDLSHCKNLQQIPELPSSLRFLDVHCSDGISSNPPPLPIHAMVNYCKPEIWVPWVHACHTSCIGNGISIVIPISGILEWIRYQSMGGHKVTIELPLNWYENNYNEPEKAFLFKTIHPSQESPYSLKAFACWDLLYAVLMNPTMDLPMNLADTSDNEPDNGSAYQSQYESSDNEPNSESAYESPYESADTSDNEPDNRSTYESENE
ncbi:hypothetical protein CK203_059762 [Vitis vinifera]|uniref:Uncharacterized protein n=1 Tax=Vitis vinifera TaxID=29760 RepID=A0A438FSG3_VITVI|nr:hypothetical protein CK203_059762 [Vitis vinifera]